MKTILILDDEQAVRESFADYFEDRMWRPLQAASGEKALALLEKEPLDAVIVDIRLGGMDGNTFIRKAYVKKKKTAFVICTGSPEYDIPATLLKLPNVSAQVHRKPLNNLGELEKDLLRLIAILQKKE